MLAVLGEPFDSGDHFFEIKWDGIRALAFREAGGLRLMSRGGKEVSTRYPELEGLAGLPEGIVLDGEIVALNSGRPSFEAVLRRHLRVGSPPPAGSTPVTYVAFDLLYRGYDCLTDLSFIERRGRLEELLGASAQPHLTLSDGVRADGTLLFRKACDEGLEGVVAKRLTSPYAPGRRNGAWVKIKRRLRAHVAIVGFIEKGKRDFQALLLAGNGLPGQEEGSLRYVGSVGSGFNEALRARLNGLLRARPRSTPLVPCPERGRWTEPGLYCMVSFAEVTSSGMLRAPVFEELIET